MKKLPLLILPFLFISFFVISCKVEDDPTIDNPEVEYVVIDSTLQAFYPKPSPSSTFEGIYGLDFDASILNLNCIMLINLYWYDPAAEHGIYLHFNNSVGDVLIDANGFIKAFNSGVKIDSALAGTWSGYDDGIFSYDYVANPAANKGNLAGQGDKYIVFRAYDAAAPQTKYYGWLRVRVSANGRSVEVLSAGFQKNPNRGLLTGER